MLKWNQARAGMAFQISKGTYCWSTLLPCMCLCIQAYFFIPTTGLAIIYSPHKAASSLFFFSENLVKNKRKVKRKCYCTWKHFATSNAQTASYHFRNSNESVLNHSRKAQQSTFSKRMSINSERHMSSECLYNMQKARAAITPRKHTVQIAAFQNSKQSSLYSYEVKAFFYRVYPKSDLLGKPTNATT